MGIIGMFILAIWDRLDWWKKTGQEGKRAIMWVIIFIVVYLMGSCGD